MGTMFMRTFNWEPTDWGRNRERKKNDARPPIKSRPICWLALFLLLKTHRCRSSPSIHSFSATQQNNNNNHSNNKPTPSQTDTITDTNHDTDTDNIVLGQCF
mmetsp:Transcript_14681/g.33744  ORF Transcript_14681/g.33744 Transcript_14681/m.33744 type:complete len:102 (+) Transcript_14681:48-353(+)